MKHCHRLKHFQIVIELHPQGSDELKKKISIDEAYLTGKSFGIDATGVGVTTYNFTGTRISGGIKKVNLRYQYEKANQRRYFRRYS